MDNLRIAGVSVNVVLSIVALVCFVLAAFGVGGRINLVALGLACWLLAQLVR